MQVSIPFKREGTGKVWLKLIRIRSYSGFHSLQTGRYMESRFDTGEDRESDRKVSIPFKREGTGKDRINWTLSFEGGEFQFPSNGKVRGKGT